MTTLAERIKSERKRLKLNQAELARLVDVKMGQSFISMLETGSRSESPYIPELAHIFGVDAYWLKTGKGERTKASKNRVEEPEELDQEIFSRARKLTEIVEKLSSQQIDLLIDVAKAIMKFTPPQPAKNAPESELLSGCTESTTTKTTIIGEDGQITGNTSNQQKYQ